MAALQKPIVLSTLATMLGTRADVGAVCTSDNINMWAKYRPIRHSSIAELTDAQRKEANQGYQFDTYTSLDALITAMKTAGEGACVWTYGKPRGAGQTPQEWYRMLDFVGYDTFLANPPFRYEIKPKDSYRGDTVKVDSTAFPMSQFTESDFKWSLLAMSDLQIGCAMRQQGTTGAPQIAFCPLSNAPALGLQQAMSSGLSAGQSRAYDVVFFASNRTFSIGDAPQTGIYAPVPYSYVTAKYTHSFASLKIVASFDTTAYESMTLELSATSGTFTCQMLRVSMLDVATGNAYTYDISSSQVILTTTPQRFTIRAITTAEKRVWKTNGASVDRNVIQWDLRFNQVTAMQPFYVRMPIQI